MEVIGVKTNRQRREYINFVYKVYKNDPCYRNINLLFVKNFLWQKDAHAKRCRVRPFIIKDEGDIKAVCTFVSSEDMEELRLSFLEFLPNARIYLQELLKQGRLIAQNQGLKKIVIGINGHISYGLGILVGKKKGFEFNGNYNPSYYTKELDRLNLVTKKAFSYKYSIETSIFKQDILDDVYSSYTFRTMNKHSFKEEILLFGELCDRVMQGTPYYSTKTKTEMYELLKQMKPLLKNDDIIFALKDEKEVGFIFTHPDYAEFSRKQKINYVSVFLKNRFKHANKLIYNIIGVLPEYRHTALAFALIHQTGIRVCEGYKDIVSSFVLVENEPSTKACRIFSQGIEREYNLYELEV